ncbi:MAG: phosphoglycerate mutase [Pseudomonadota bacterium]|nr:phosphoglycerate mutase [Pseudomonadota bacterium]
MSRHPLAREVAFAVAVKLMILVAAAVFVFGPGHRPRIDAASVQERLIGVSPAAPHPRNISP